MRSKELKIYTGNGTNYAPIPKIILQGKWLDNIGFSIGEKVSVSFEENKIVIEKVAEIEE